LKNKDFRLKFSNKKSFSLIELLVVFALLTILFVLALPYFTFFERSLIKSETERLFAVIVYLQQRSIASCREQRLVLNAAGNGYSYNIPPKKESVYFLNKAAAFGFLKGSKGPPADPKELIKKSITFPKTEKTSKNYRITFWPNGKIGPGTVYLIGRKENYMMAITCRF